jgi:hypothetical protein
MAPSATEEPVQSQAPVQAKELQTDVVAQPIASQGGEETAVKAPALAAHQSQEADLTTKEGSEDVLTGHREPLQLSGALDQFKYFESTPTIGREYEDINLAEILRAPNSDDLIRDLAITSMNALVRFEEVADTNQLFGSLSTWCRFLPQAR